MNVKHQRIQARLFELLNEGVSLLNNDTLNDLTVLRVDLHKGRYDADVYIDGTDISQDMRGSLIAKLNKASGFLKSHCLASESWFKAPNLHFHFDDSLETYKRIDDIFEQIRSKDE